MDFYFYEGEGKRMRRIRGAKATTLIRALWGGKDSARGLIARKHPDDSGVALRADSGPGYPLIRGTCWR